MLKWLQRISKLGTGLDMACIASKSQCGAKCLNSAFLDAVGAHNFGEREDLQPILEDL